MQPKLQAGQVWTNPRYYQDDSGKWHRKHILVLAIDEYDVTHRPFTKVDRDRSTTPPCGHEPKFRPAYFVGSGLLACLPLPTWVDLSFRDDDDIQHWDRLFRVGLLIFVGTLPQGLFCEILKCAAGSGGTTDRQRRKLLDVRSQLGCP